MNFPKKLLGFFAHPDDETFGAGSSLALMAEAGTEIHLVFVTRGQAGGTDSIGEALGAQREQEARKAAQILGIAEVEFLDYQDGQLCNQDLPELSRIFADKIRDWQPDAVITFNLNGYTGHLDHIAVSSATTKAFDDTHIAEKLYYYTGHESLHPYFDNYFVHFPEGIAENEADLVLDTSGVKDKVIQACHCHQSQANDMNTVLEMLEKLPAKNLFLIRTQKSL